MAAVAPGACSSLNKRIAVTSLPTDFASEEGRKMASAVKLARGIGQQAVGALCRSVACRFETPCSAKDSHLALYQLSHESDFPSGKSRRLRPDIAQRELWHWKTLPRSVTACQLATDMAFCTAVSSTSRDCETSRLSEVATGGPIGSRGSGEGDEGETDREAEQKKECLDPERPWIVRPRRTPVSYLELGSSLSDLRGKTDSAQPRTSLTQNTEDAEANNAGFKIHEPAGALEQRKEDNVGVDDGSTTDEAGTARLTGGRSFGATRKDLTQSEQYLGSIRKRWFPYINEFDLGKSEPLDSAEVIRMLEQFLVDGRKARILKVVAARTYQIVPVVEGLSDLGNVSAVCRTAEALGLQSVQVIANTKRKMYKDNRSISMGTDKWLDVELWQSTTRCYETLRSRGYRIAVTHISPDTVPIYDLDWTIPTAVVLGNEHRGVTPEALDGSDVRICIPMSGMVDSFNISVAAAITLHHAVRDRIQRQGFHGDLTEEEQQILAAEFLMRSNRHTPSIIEQLLSEKGVTLGQKANALEKFLRKHAPLPS